VEEGEGDLNDLLVAVRTLTYLGWVIAAYAPSSHAFLYVAFVLAERTLFMPSFGAAMLIADGLRAVASGRVWGGVLPLPPWCRWGPSKGGKGAKQQQQQPQQRARPLVSLGVFLALALYYGVRIWVRNYDWATEEALLRSNLRIYPEHNGMTQYGMGAIKLYQQKFPEAEELLKRALVETTLAEPHILLSQLYWKHYGNYTSAITQLEAIEHTTSPRKEVMQNLGLLLMATGAAPPTNVTQRTRAEYLILLGHAAHGYPMGHPNIGLLASNAACVRVVSEPTRFASPQLAESLFKEALTFRHSSRVTAFKNNALFYAAMGQSAQAYRVAEEAIAYIEELRDRVDQPEEGKKQANEFINNFRILQLSLDVHAPQVEAWLEQGLVAGQAAEDRLAFIGGDCSMELGALLWKE
jgi:tetratricopeptide (TPR) repeat protein